jgi:hypothetical protein
MGRVGVITHRERHDGGFNILHIKDAIDNTFATRESNVFVIGQEKPWISLPKGKGVKVRYTICFYPLISATYAIDSSPSLRSVTAAAPTLSPTKCLTTLANSMLALISLLTLRLVLMVTKQTQKINHKTVAGKRRPVLLNGLGWCFFP